MGRKIAVWVFFATVFYQFVDAGAELFVPFYDRGGVVATLLFWFPPQEPLSSSDLAKPQNMRRIVKDVNGCMSPLLLARLSVSS